MYMIKFKFYHHHHSSFAFAQVHPVSDIRFGLVFRLLFLLIYPEAGEEEEAEHK